MELIKLVIDKYFNFLEERGGNTFPEQFIPELMLNNEKTCKYEGIRHWNPIESTIQDKEIQALENYYGHPFPESYKAFLKHRHFIELQLGTRSINFFKHLPKTLLQDTKQLIDQYFKKLLDANYLPFAHRSDYGVVCFDANESIKDYNVVWFDHEDDYSNPQPCALNFESMFIEFNEHLDEWIVNKRKLS